MAADKDEAHNRQGNKEQRNPGAFEELRDQHHAGRNSSDGSTQSVHERILPPVRAAIFPPMHNHACLRESES